MKKYFNQKKTKKSVVLNFIFLFNLLNGNSLKLASEVTIIKSKPWIQQKNIFIRLKLILYYLKVLQIFQN